MKKIILWSLIALFMLSYCEAFALVSVSGNVTYAGSQTGDIYVEAFMGSGCGDMGVPGYAIIVNPGPYNINIPTGTYYICAFRDVNDNGIKDNNEPSGSYQYNPINLAHDKVNESNINITLYDPQATAVPTMTEWGMIIMSLMLAGTAIWMIRRRQIA
jgi:hypothetical protein